MSPRGVDAPVDTALEELLNFIRDSRGFDFTGYKRSTLTRRIRKRMAEVGVAEYLDYRDMLETNADEFHALFNTILINVTGFFRDLESWEFLQREVLPPLLDAVDSDQEIRVWSAGCSTGEEAYTLALVLAEVLGLEQCVRRVKIYSTDIDEDALRQARAGAYSPKSLEALPDELRGRYFEQHGERLIVRADLRRRVIFGRHDITKDAPISRLHLLVCRNTLMYFNVEAQAKIVDRFSFALNDGGCLFLGKAEMLLADGERFEAAAMRQRIFRRRQDDNGVARPLATIRSLRQLRRQEGPPPEPASSRRLIDLVLESAPSAVIAVDIDGVVVQINAEAREKLGLGPPDLGRPFRDLEISYRPLELRSLIEQAQATRRPVRVNAVERVLPADEVQYLDIIVQPLITGAGDVLGTGLSFIDNSALTRLQREVKRNREELETAYEELQSTNEELETTNEELQSGNEELETMNEEMRIRSSELDEARTYLEGVLSSIAAGVVVLDADLRVRSWNRGAEELWGLRPGEVHRQPFFTLEFGLPTGEVADLVQSCFTTGKRTGPVEVVAVNRLGRSIVCSIMCSPLMDPGHGVVLLMESVDTG